MSQPDWLRYFLDYNFGTSVVTVNFQDWAKMVRQDGAVTWLEGVPEKLSGAMKDAEVVVAVASGIANPSPGIDIVRIQGMHHLFTIPGDFGTHPGSEEEDRENSSHP